LSPAANTALIVVDVQQGMDDPRLGERNNREAERRIAELLAAWRHANRPIVHVQHLSREPASPLREAEPGSAFKPEAMPRAGEPVFRKHAHAAFVGTDLEAHLRAHGILDLIVVGLTTDHCVSTTVRLAADLGFTVTVVGDATATFARPGPDGSRIEADLVHRVELACLHGEFATVVTTQDILAAFAA
jgi:nicotinamidase-related amidase